METSSCHEVPAKSRCAQPGHKKQMRQHQQLELGTFVGFAVPGVPTAARPTAFTAAAQAGLMDAFLNVDPDMQARVLERYAQHVKELKHGAHHG